MRAYEKEMAEFRLANNVIPYLPRYRDARAVLETKPFHESNPSAFVASLPVVDGKRVAELLDEEARLEARITAIREELANHLGLGREYVRARDRENLREDAATLVLLRYLGVRGVQYWERALALIYAQVFGWKPSVKLYKHKMQR
jgi:hypothetical protein